MVLNRYRLAASYNNNIQYSQLFLHCWSEQRLCNMAAIVSDEEVFSQFTEDSRKAYRRAWSLFVEFSPDCDFEAGPPGEEVLSKYFKHQAFQA